MSWTDLLILINSLDTLLGVCILVLAGYCVYRKWWKRG